MKLSRRKVLSGIGGGSLAGVVTALAAAAGDRALADEPPRATRAPRTGAYDPVHTLNGWTLPARVEGGVKVFHLVAEEIEHEFAPGCRAKCWGYNGTTPGPTIEAVEGDRVRIYVTNRLPEHTSVHWHGILLPSGMDGVGGLTQRHIQPGETYVYEFTLRQHGTHMYHPHADEMVQMAVGMMGMFIIHPKNREADPVDRDYCLLLHNWALHPGTYRPDPSILQDFDLWTMNSKVFPAIEPLVARSGERVRIRMGNLSMWNHPMHLHGVVFQVTGGDGGRWPRALWRPEVTEIVAVGQTRDIEFDAVAGDWAFHCHMSHHTMNAMAHDLPNNLGVDQSGVEDELRTMLPGYRAMGQSGMAEHGEHLQMGLKGPANTLPMMSGQGPFGPLEMGGMFTVVKVRDALPANPSDVGWYEHPKGTQASRVSTDPDFGSPVRRPTPP
ncbi:FtsP/CotA-like multicopper oxidase with cupredoxin domain [Panacagrimonas perspica]|uniref:FtsP/CotA-like multicopper oxidase with cupredoxin domain n=1 Tax=Panacagrimonas perspica TaxID=381431 RepID=A0A4S3K969_9GAMM|nr:copper oxidase [Panacagrimonas perspica]TDU24265.1 FtsP/CotA-like multicopper oxidase with cupredoxin domain [Panacagrimonas perspica]THD04668.1 copper oxidase [Panacagrimonas perspica]